jgi:hypothetical protein
MPVITRSPRSRPQSAPAYYLARPASVWITALHRQPPFTAGLAVRHARVLTPLGDGNNDHPPAACVSRTAGYPAGDEPAAIPGVTAIPERASR